MKKIAIIVAGGSGLRAGGQIPKQLQLFGDKPMFTWSMKAFLEEYSGTRIILVVNERFRDMFEAGVANVRTSWPPFDCAIVAGGATRAESVHNALKTLAPEDDMYIAVHDAARPLVPVDMIKRGWEAARNYGAVVPSIPLTDSIRELDDTGKSHTVPRANYRAVQTPQVFKADLLINAYNKLSDPDSVTDDASVVELAGHNITLYHGEPRNIKITQLQDFIIAAALI
ncbi:MAG: 2-C-methyl-D-erythritol 4-phosphate cytidylyltransferase [Muribaculaceae bacterium]|nr:2-C-methyl-D-erythritol 4-phosphate cytidylyltransferase [Muribaculaceae bacterium]